MEGNRIFYGWYIVAAGCAISFYTAGTIMMGFTAVVDPISKEFGWSYTQISLASSLRGLEVGLLGPIAGLLMDRLGPRRLVFGGAFLVGVGLMAMSRMTSLLFFYVSMVIVALGVSTMTSTLLMTITARWFRRKAGLTMGITASGVALGGLLIPIVTLLEAHYGWRTAIASCAVGMWVMLMPLSLLLRHKPEDYGLLPDGEKEVDGSGSADTPTPVLPEKQTTVKKALTSSPFWIISVASMMLMLPIAALGTHIMPYLGSIGFERVNAAVIASAVPLLTIVGRIGFGWVGDHLDKRTVFSLAFALMSVGLFALPRISADSWVLVIVFVLFYGIGWGAAVPMMSGLLRNYFGLSHLASIMGFSGSVMFIGMIAGPPAAGWTYDQWGHYEPFWYGLAVSMALTAIIFRLVMKQPSSEG